MFNFHGLSKVDILSMGNVHHEASGGLFLSQGDSLFNITAGGMCARRIADSQCSIIRWFPLPGYEHLMSGEGDDFDTPLYEECYSMYVGIPTWDDVISGDFPTGVKCLFSLPANVYYGKHYRLDEYRLSEAELNELDDVYDHFCEAESIPGFLRWRSKFQKYWETLD